MAGTPFDFRAMKPIGRDIAGVGARGGEQLAIARGYDHNWVLTRPGYRLAAVACDPGSGIVLWTYTDQPGVQLYTANFLVGDLVGTSGRAYRQGDAFALETQHFPTRRTTSAIRAGRRSCCGPVRSCAAGRRTGSPWRGRAGRADPVLGPALGHAAACPRRHRSR